ncbi:MAG: glycosyl transferase family 2 [Microbacteriaceae bacterium]|nr:glycosyl transferase family 2 [Microbacteriaceae bacterium]
MMPFYGRFDHFREAVKSVLAQTDPDWRLTILDDVYPDLAPGEWAKAIVDPRVTYLRNDTNLRPSRNYNKAVSLATGTFVVIMGCDDVMLPGFVGKARELIDRFPDADIIQPGVSVIDENGAASRPLADRVKGWLRPRGPKPRLLRGETLAASLMGGNWTYFPSLIWRRERLSNGFRTDLDVVQDLAKLMEITLENGSLALDDSVVFEYRRHSGSVSSKTGPDGSKFAQEQIVFDECAAACEALGWHRAARIARRHLTSRLNAATELRAALRFGTPDDRRAVIRHVIGRSAAARRR